MINYLDTSNTLVSPVVRITSSFASYVVMYVLHPIISCVFSSFTLTDPISTRSILVTLGSVISFHPILLVDYHADITETNNTEFTILLDDNLLQTSINPLEISFHSWIRRITYLPNHLSKHQSMILLSTLIYK